MGNITAELLLDRERAWEWLSVAQQRPTMDMKVVGVMSESMQDLHKQHTRLKMDLVSMFDGFHNSLSEVCSVLFK